jgi:hypothetical protein
MTSSIAIDHCRSGWGITRFLAGTATLLWLFADREIPRSVNMIHISERRLEWEDRVNQQALLLNDYEQETQKNMCGLLSLWKSHETCESRISLPSRWAIPEGELNEKGKPRLRMPLQTRNASSLWETTRSHEMTPFHGIRWVTFDMHRWCWRRDVSDRAQGHIHCWFISTKPHVTIHRRLRDLENTTHWKGAFQNPINMHEQSNPVKLLDSTASAFELVPSGTSINCLARCVVSQ